MLSEALARDHTLRDRGGYFEEKAIAGATGKSTGEHGEWRGAKGTFAALKSVTY